MLDNEDFVTKVMSLFKSFHSFVEYCWSLLVDQYQQAECGPNIDKTAFTGIHDQFVKFLSKAKVDVKLVLPGTAQKCLQKGDVDVVLELAEAGPSSSKKNKCVWVGTNQIYVLSVSCQRQPTM